MILLVCSVISLRTNFQARWHKINKIHKFLQFHNVKRLGTGAVVLHVNRFYNIERLIIEVINHFVIFSVDQLLADRRCAFEHAFEIRKSQLQ